MDLEVLNFNYANYTLNAELYLKINKRNTK